MKLYFLDLTPPGLETADREFDVQTGDLLNVSGNQAHDASVPTFIMFKVYSTQTNLCTALLLVIYLHSVSSIWPLQRPVKQMCSHIERAIMSVPQPGKNSLKRANR